MKTIYKYRLPGSTSGTVKMPFGAQILTAILQDDVIVIYAVIHTTQEKTYNQVFHVFGTGHKIPDDVNLNYLNTLEDTRGLVWHVFNEHNIRVT